MKAEEILRTAADMVSGPRKKQHGEVHDVFETVAALYAITTGVEIAPLDGIMFMVCLKISRMINGNFNIDDYIDACGYLALAGQLAGEFHEG